MTGSPSQAEAHVDRATAAMFLNGGVLVERVHTYDNVTLFLFSAATWNPHRVHYDDQYTRKTAGEPGLLVQGPLQAAHMFQALRDSLAAGVTVESLAYRHRAVLHVGESVRIGGSLRSVDVDTATADLWVEKADTEERTTTGGAVLRRPVDGA